MSPKAGLFAGEVTPQAPADDSPTSKDKGYWWMEYGSVVIPPALPSASNVLAWWEFEEAGGFRPSFYDEVSGYEMKGLNDVDKLPGVIGQGVDLKITGNEYVETIDVPTQYALAIEDREWSCIVWHTTKAAIVPDGYVVSGWDDDLADLRAGVRQWRVKTNAAGNGFDFRITEDNCPVVGYVEIATGDIGLTTETRYQIVVTHDPVANEMTMTVNAGTRLTASISGGAIRSYDIGCALIPNTAQVIHLGASEGTILGTENNCEQDMLSFWDIALTAENITALNNSNAGVAFSGLPA